MRKDNLLNQKFGSWIVVAPAENLNGRTRWLCRCENCGEEKIMYLSNLKRVSVHSCTHEMNKRCMDLTGQKFGMLTVIENVYVQENGTRLWRCECDCGNTIRVSTNELITGDTKSCGCLKQPPRKLQRVCKNCGKTFTGAPRSMYCPKCSEERKKAQKRVYNERAKYGTTRKIGQEYPCEICGELYILVSGSQRFCKKCAEIRSKEVTKALAIERYNRKKDKTNPARQSRRRTERKENKEKIAK